MELALWEAALLVAVGVVGGFLNVMAGGGSLLTVPVMVFLGIPGPVANGTNRIAILAQNASAIATFARRGFSDLRLSLSLGLCAVPGAATSAVPVTTAVAATTAVPARIRAAASGVVRRDQADDRVAPGFELALTDARDTGQRIERARPGRCDRAQRAVVEDHVGR